ncbi:MAG: ABC transporter permease [Acidimicrobiia bacterium]
MNVGAGRVRRIWKGRFSRELRSNRGGMVALAVLAALLLIGLGASWFAPHDPNAQDLLNRLAGPTRSHPLGTDDFGRDVLSRLMSASWISLRSSGQAVLVAAAIGIPGGLIAGYFPGIIDGILSRIAEAIMSLPGLIFAIAIVGVLGPGLTNAMFVLGVIISPVIFRVMRASTSTARHQNFVEAARALGCSTPRLLVRHVLPNAISPVLVQLTFAAGVAIIGEASLSFLGLGAVPPTTSWGTMIRDSSRTIHRSIVPFLPPAAMITITVITLSVFGEALREAIGGGRR